MRRGTRVGQAYVSATVDGSGINEEIADAVEDGFDGSDDIGDRAGRRAGERFSARFRERMDTMRNRIGDGLAERIALRGRDAGDGFNDVFQRRVRELGRTSSSRGFELLGHDAGDRMGHALGDRLRATLRERIRGINIGDIEGDRFVLLGRADGTLFGVAAGTAASTWFSRTFRESTTGGFVARHRAPLALAGRRAGDAFGDGFEDGADRRVSRLPARLFRGGGGFGGGGGGRGFVGGGEDAGDDFGRGFGDGFNEREAYILGIVDRLGDRIGDRISHRLRQSITETMDDLDERGVFDRRRDDDDVSRNRRRRGGRDNDLLGDRIGRLFGAGSRNNFLNVFGRLVGGLSGIFAKVTKGAGSLFKTFIAGAKEGTGLLDKFKKGFLALGEGGGGFLSSLVKSGPAAAAAIAAVSLALSVMVSVLSAVIALVTALAATITSALVGALTVLGGSILAVVAAGGLLTAAFMSMTDAQKDLLKNAFTPLREEMVGIGQIMLQEMVPAFAVWSENLQRALALAAPVAQVMGKAFAEAGKSLTAAFSGPGFVNFANALGTYLPGIVKSLSGALGGFLNGLLGLFSAVMPFVLQFAQYLERVANRFSEWANSAQGQNAIVDFTERALESLKSLWNFTREFFGFLGDVLFSEQAQDAGNSMFDSLARTFRRFRDDVAKAAADGRLKKWFDDAIEFGGDLKDVMQGLTDIFQALNDSNVLDALGKALSGLGKAMSFVSGEGEDMGPVLNGISKALGASLNPVGTAINGIQTLGHAMRGENGNIADAARGIAQSWGLLENTVSRTAAFERAAAVFASVRNAISGVVASVSNSIAQASTQAAGSAAIAQTNLPWQNPYTAWANSLIKDGPSVVAQIRKAIRDLNTQVAAAIRQSAVSKDGSGTAQALLTMTNNFRDQGRALVDAAQAAVDSAAQRLAGASTAKEANKALRELRRAQAALQKALDAQQGLNAAAKIISSQRLIKTDNVVKLVNGLKAQNVTLAEFARAREILAGKIKDAQDALDAAIQTRDSFNTQVTESIRAYGSLVSAQAKTLNGIEQALTAGDVTQNLRDRLAKIKAFQDNLRVLLAQGLSDEAYKQLVEAGVEGGSATAAALVAGGKGAIDEVNSLLSQIGAEGSSLGSAAADRMYQNGVNMAKGLLDGLKSLDAQLATQAAKLGDTIAGAIRRALGIKSPSRVMIAAMDEVGNGAVIGLDNQSTKVSAAAGRLANRIAVSPEVAAYTASQRTSTADEPVSGNGQKFRDLVVVTPTKDPKAVAIETLNEVTGRL